MADEARAVIFRPAEAVEAVALGPNRVEFLLGSSDTGGAYSLTAWTMAPLPAPGPPVHIHRDADETIAVVAGTLRCEIGERAVTAGPGAVVLVPKGTPHTLANVGPEPARFLVILAPPGFEGYWREVAALLGTMQGAPDPATLLTLQAKYHMESGGLARRFE
jgi:mannose-6-phosphate isomerase-like protein (cupin superfamily)